MRLIKQGRLFIESLNILHHFKERRLVCVDENCLLGLQLYVL